MTSTATTAETASHTRRRPPRGRVAKTFLVLGELLITFGVIVFLFIFYELKVTDWQTADDQHRLSRQLQQEWQKPAPAPALPPNPQKPVFYAPSLSVPEGQGFAILRIPRFGPGYHWVVVEGVNRDDLEEGPGHYPGTAWPGQVGNMVMSGHRTTYGHPFNRFNELQPGDVIQLQVRNRVYTYHVIRKQVVDPSDTAVILPVPGKFAAKPTQRLLTMTTCHPEYSAAQRLVVTAELTEKGT